MNMRLFNWIALGTMAVLSLHSSTADAIFASVKSTGMAATAISHPIDSLAGAYNPAGMLTVGDRVDLEAGWVRSDARTTIVGNAIPELNQSYHATKYKNAFPVSGGLNKVWSFGCDCDWEVSTGFVAYDRHYQKTSYYKVLPLLGTSKPGLEYLHATAAPVVAVRWRQSHTLGLSVNYNLQRIKFNGLQNFAQEGALQRSLEPHHVTNRGYDYTSGWGVTLGYFGQWTDNLSVGLTYQPKTSMSRMKKYDGVLANHGRLDIPQKIGAGIAYTFINCVTAAFDFEYIEWSQIKALHNPFFRDGIPVPLGSNEGPGFGFRDQMFYRLGVEWEINPCWTVRAGYRYANTPTRRSQTAVNLLLIDLVESFATLGATWNVTECQEISIAGAYGFEHKVKGKDSLTPELPPEGFGGGNVNLKEQKFALGLAWALKF